MSKRKFHMSINEIPMQVKDREDIIGAYKRIAALKALMQKNSIGYLKKDAMEFIREEISNLRERYIHGYAHKFYEVHLRLGNETITSDPFDQYPCTQDLQYMKQNLVSMFKDKKKKVMIEKFSRGGKNGSEIFERINRMKKDKVFHKSILGYEYQMPGDAHATNKGMFGKGHGLVFDKPGSILKLLNDPDQQYRRIRKDKLPYDKSNYVGVELELIAKLGRDDLNKLFIAEKLAGYVYVKGDGSVRPDNPGEHAHEVTVLAKQQHIHGVIERVCKVLNEKAGGYANNSCGLHVHIDMRQRDPTRSYANLVRGLPILAAMVPAMRSKGDWCNRYCAINTNDSLGYDGNRYKAINDVALNSHKTLEVRLHSGSTNATKINNWITILLAIVETTNTTYRTTTLNEFMSVFNIPGALGEYIAKRMKKFEDNSIDTKKDEMEKVS